MEVSEAARYWCHMCSQVVSPIMEVELKCPFCQSGFVEEMDSTSSSRSFDETDFASDRALSLWAPILLGMMGNPRRRRRFRRYYLDDEDDDDDENENRERPPREGETELDRELDSIIRRRRRSSATILQLLQGIRAGMATESENSDNDRDRERERVILINPFNQTIIVQGSSDSNQDQNPLNSLGDYFIGPGLDLLLQHLAENDPNRYGTPPAQKEAVEALPVVKVVENLQCSVCLDDFDLGAEAKEMPCKHKFHSACILPWLEMHSSCPVCRYQLPADESKRDSEVSRSSNNSGEGTNVNDTSEDGDREERSERRFTLPWPFSTLFSSSGSQSSGGTSLTQASSSASSTGAPGTASQTDDV
ncbi:hypothetical protein Ancab_024789 [Ancistrocladus abbreviatus]